MALLLLHSGEHLLPAWLADCVQTTTKMTDEEKHEISIEMRPFRDPWLDCSCGARWRVPFSEDTQKMDREVEATTAAHKSYFNRPATRVD